MRYSGASSAVGDDIAENMDSAEARSYDLVCYRKEQSAACCCLWRRSEPCHRRMRDTSTVSRNTSSASTIDTVDQFKDSSGKVDS